MPIFIDPKWEFWEPDEEITEILASSNRSPNLFDLVDDRLYKENLAGIRFGTGNPDRCFFKLAPEKIKEERPEVHKRECLVCGCCFQPDRNSRVLCSSDCAKLRPRKGKPRTLEDRKCDHCNKVFRPRTAITKYCGRSCFFLSQLKKMPDSQSGACLYCGGLIPPSKSRNQKTKRKYCKQQCKKNYISRRFRLEGHGMLSKSERERNEQEPVPKRTPKEIEFDNRRKKALGMMAQECPVRHHPKTHDSGEQQHYHLPGGRVGCFSFNTEVPEGWLPTTAQLELWKVEDDEKGNVES